jgi:hypothetical protein
MAVHKFPVASVHKVRHYLRRHLLIPPLEDQPAPPALEEVPEPVSLDGLGQLFRIGSSQEEAFSTPNREGRWFISTADAGAVFAHLPMLRLKPGFHLVTYLYRTTTSGVGMTWAVPAPFSTTAHLEEALKAAGDAQTPPYPERALLNVMAAVAGDQSPLSFITASLLQRELQEFGYSGDAGQWCHHRLIGAAPPQRTWQWQIKPPVDLTPKVRRLSDGQTTVEFFTGRVVPPVGLFRHMDRYPVGHYVAKVTNQAVATVKTARVATG